jgi:hypothetical protein
MEATPPCGDGRGDGGGTARCGRVARGPRRRSRIRPPSTRSRRRPPEFPRIRLRRPPVATSAASRARRAIIRRRRAASASDPGRLVPRGRTGRALSSRLPCDVPGCRGRLLPRPAAEWTRAAACRNQMALVRLSMPERDRSACGPPPTPCSPAHVRADTPVRRKWRSSTGSAGRSRGAPRTAGSPSRPKRRLPRSGTHPPSWPGRFERIMLSMFTGVPPEARSLACDGTRAAAVAQDSHLDARRGRRRSVPCADPGP